MPEKDFNPNARSLLPRHEHAIARAQRLNGPQSAQGPFTTRALDREHCGNGSNLCISFVHVGECSDWESDWERLTAWIDNMPFVWAKTLETEHLEVEAALKIALRVRPSEVHRPFGRLGRSMRQAVEAARTAGWDALKTLPFVHTDAIRDNIAEVAQAGISDATLASNRAYNTRVTLRTLARDAHNRLMERQDAEYMTVQIGQAIQDRLVERTDEEGSRP